MELPILIGVALVFIGYLTSSKLVGNNVLIKSSLDGRMYNVRYDTDDHLESANTLAELHKRLYVLSNSLDSRNIYHKRILQKLKTIHISENPVKIPSTDLTSYTVNKGEELVMCLRNPKTSKIHDIDILTYVMIHEISHVACPEVGHTPLFKKIFANLLEISMYKANILKKIDYSKFPENYCGIVISEYIVPTSSI